MMTTDRFCTTSKNRSGFLCSTNQNVQCKSRISVVCNGINDCNGFDENVNIVDCGMIYEIILLHKNTNHEKFRLLGYLPGK